MGDKRRFDKIASFVEEYLPPRMKEIEIADIAGGKGFLQLALRERGFTNVTTWDKRHHLRRRKVNYRYQLFKWDEKKRYDLIIGMHPDEATDHMILYAAKHKITAIICPCCIKPSATFYNGPHKYPLWLEYLKKLAVTNGLFVKEYNMSINGRRTVIVLRPYPFT
jgi:hypothetical protein